MSSPGSLASALRERVDRLLTPALVVDLAAVEHNARAMLRRCGGAEAWRPHVKTVKQEAVVAVLLEQGVRCFKCATIGELRVILGAGARAGVATDTLVAYPLRGAAFRAVRAAAAAAPGARVQLLADSPAHARELQAWADGAAIEAHLDVDLGMGRTGTAPETWSDALAAGLTRELPAVRITGLHGYDGHHRRSDRDAAWRGYARLCALARRLEAPSLDLVTSGTHSYGHALAHPELRAGPWRHQVSPGTIVLCDLRSRDAVDDLGLQQAAFVATRVVHVGDGHVTLDAGSKAITPDGAPPTSAVLGRPGLVPERASEEHLPVRVEHGPAPALGELLFLIPDHVCTTVNLHRAAVWVRGDRWVGWGAVEAAAHELWVGDP
jgi:D-serine deaminase-like pyridoxal phosphate-dependent protein